MVEIGLDELMDLRNEAIAIVGEAQYSHSRFNFFIGILLGIAGNFLVTYWVEYQKLRGLLTINSLIISSIVWIIIIIIGYKLYLGSSSRIGELNNRANTILFKIEYIMGILPSLKKDD